LRAAAVDGFAGVGAQGVDEAGRGHGLQGAVDRREADALAAATQFVVQLLGRAELVDGVQQLGDGRPLPGRSHAGCAHRLSSPAWATASTTMWARWWSTSR